MLKKHFDSNLHLPDLQIQYCFWSALSVGMSIDPGDEDIASPAPGVNGRVSMALILTIRATVTLAIKMKNLRQKLGGTWDNIHPQNGRTTTLHGNNGLSI